jgi:hypothetical protein
MIRANRFTGKIVCAALLVALAASLLRAPAAEASNRAADRYIPVWEITLQQQLLGERRCQLASVLYTRDFKEAGHRVLEGRVRCHDGREFDFTRPQPHAPFSIRLCQPAAC